MKINGFRPGKRQITSGLAKCVFVKRKTRLRNNTPYVLLQPVLNTTHSVDRLCGAKTVISKLDELGAICIVTTHDLELCELEQQFRRIKNYSFSEHYENNKICFDYKMMPGKSNTTNARYLMEMVGIL